MTHIKFTICYDMTIKSSIEDINNKRDVIEIFDI